MKIEHFRSIDKGGSLKASFQAIFLVQPWGEWHINICFFQKDNGQSWFGYPNREYTNQEGERKFFKQAYPDESIKDSFEKDLKEALVTQIPVMKDILSSQPNQVQEAPLAEVFDQLPF